MRRGSRYKEKQEQGSTIVSWDFVLAIFLCVSAFFSNSYASSQFPQVKPSLKPLDLSVAPTTKALMAAGQLGGPLYPTRDVQNKDKERTFNLSFGQAIEEWNKHNYKGAVGLFKNHMDGHSDSPWTSEAALHMGCEANYNGRFSEAEEQFAWIIQHNKDSPHEGARRLTGKAMLRLGVLRVAQNNPDAALEIFTELKEKSLDWRERTYASHWIQRISRHKAEGLALLRCGTEALAYLFEKKGKKVEAREIARIIPETDKGHSIADLVRIAKDYGYKLNGLKLSSSELSGLPLPAIMQIEGRYKGDKGHYWILEKIVGDRLYLYDPQSRQRFRQTVKEFSGEWNGKALVSASEADKGTRGEELSSSLKKQSYGGCCGVPHPEADLGKPEKMEPKPCPEGAPVWAVNNINMNLYMTDIPLWYNPPIGPRVKIQLSYNSQSAIAYNEPFGNKWMFNYGSYPVVDTAGNVTLFMPDGRRDTYSPDGQGGYTKPFEVFNTLTRIADNHYELKFPDGTVYVYDIPAGTTSQQPFLVEISNAYGQKLTFSYNSDVKLTTITDAMHRDTTVYYNTEGLVDHVTDPFGRSAWFEYDADGNLTKITDMGGIWTRFSYDADVYLTGIENAKGAWGIYIEPSDGQTPANSDNYPPPGDYMWQNYRITITNPLTGKEEYFYYGGCDFSGFGCGGQTWYVSPRDYVEWQSQETNNYRSNPPKTRYFFSTVSGRGKISQILYPEGGYTKFTYDTVTGKPESTTDYHGNDTNNNPIKHARHYTYNGNGLVSSFTDAKNIQTTYLYYPNNVDLWKVVNGLGTITYTYNGNTHDVETITDRLNIVTRYAYNSYGQLTSITEADGTAIAMTTELVYDPVTYNLSQIKRGGNVVQSFTHDNIGRVETQTDATGLTLGYKYNNLDQLTEILYPDTVYDVDNNPTAKFVDIQHSSCCPRVIDSITDRAGLTTHFTHDALKRLTQKQGPDGTITYEYDDNGNLKKLKDPDNKPTSFEYNLDNRLIKKIHADNKFIKYDYDLAGLLTKVTNSRNIEKIYTYDPNHNPLTIDYSDSTPGVVFTYDDYNRVDTRTDGMGLYQFGYDANSRLKSVNGAWADDTVSYDYDDLNHLKNLKLLRDDTTVSSDNTYLYDYDLGDPDVLKIGRLSKIQPATNTFTYGYSGVNPLIQSLTRPNGSVTEYQYNDPLKRLTALINKNSSNQIINSYGYTYNNLDLIDIETVTNGTPITSFVEGVTSYDNNNLNQLLSTTNPNRTYIYDDDGNMTQGYTPDGYTMTMTYDAENRLKTAEYTDGGSVVHRTEYGYSGDSLLAELKKYENAVLAGDIRYVRAGFLPVQERDGNNAVTREYTWGQNYGGGIGGLLNLKQGGSDYSYLYDGKGNVSALIDSSQSVVAAYAYDPFGTLMIKTGSLNQPYQFSTKEFDAETGLSYYGYRFYNTALGKWMTRDPIGERGGINQYGFVGNNPVNLVDLLGLFQYSPSAGQPVNEETAIALQCFEGCMGSGAEVTVTGAAESGHKPGSAHETGQACDLGKQSNPDLDRSTAERCYMQCFGRSSSYGQEESNHYHFQTRPGLGGATGFAPGVR